MFLWAGERRKTYVNHAFDSAMAVADGSHDLLRSVNKGVKNEWMGEKEGDVRRGRYTLGKIINTFLPQVLQRTLDTRLWW